jgi:hypothetical protein
MTNIDKLIFEEIPPDKIGSKTAKILINEIIPREAKYGVKIDPLLIGLLTRAEFFGFISRHQLRQLLDSSLK